MDTSFLKLEIFIPETHFDALQKALRQADAGHIGSYDCCLSYSRVTGTWRPLAGTSPYIGAEGEISCEPELKVEVTIRAERLAETMRAIRRAHPYEEPVINVIPLCGTGLGIQDAPVRIYDISQEVFGCAVYPGDPAPEKLDLMKMGDGAAYNLSAFRMCAHNGTHIDAPLHFLPDGKSVDRIEPDRFIGHAFVAAHEGPILAADAARLLQRAAERDTRAAERLLVKGRAVVTAEAAAVFAAAGIRLFGTESQSVGPEDAPAEVHRIMLGAQIVLLEGIRLSGVDEGVYLLHAAPLKLGGAEGAPCRATLIGLT